MRCTVSALFLLVSFSSPSDALMTRAGSGTKNAANPMRRVITMLQDMVAKVEAEGKEEAELFEKFMCYCDTGKATLGKSIADAEEKIPQVESDLKEAVGEKTQLTNDLAQHQSDRTAAKEAIAKAKSMREKEAASFAKESGEDQSNLDALTKAIAAIEKGLGGSFLQTNSAAVLRSLSLNMDMSNADRDQLSSFLMGSDSQGSSTAGSSEILGMLKQMKDTMEKDLAETVSQEETLKKDFEATVAAKESEIAQATKAIEEKTKRVGEVSVEIVNLEEDLEDTKDQLADDQKFLADLEKNCETKKKEWEEICKMRQEELIALTDVIKMLNSDEALELFKKTVPSASASLIQLQVTSSQIRQQALHALSSVKRGGTRDVDLDLITMALHGKKVSFDKVIKMIEDMVVLLKKEQVEDDNKKVYCEAEFDKADDKKKELEWSIEDLGKVIDEIKDTMKTIDEEIAALEDGIVKLDREVAGATDQRKKEHAEFETMLAANQATIKLIEMAKNRLQKFYNPKLAKAEEAPEEEAPVSLLDSRSNEVAAPPPPPEAPGKFKKKGEESAGVMAMMDTMKADVVKETQEAEFAEKDAQGEYEQMVKDAASKRAGDKKTIEEKLSIKAEQEAELIKNEDAEKVEKAELMATKEYIGELHADCDWLLENFDARKEARANEIDALKKAVAVLQGADYSLVQVGRSAVRKS